MQISLARALVELKRIEQKIAKASNAQFIGLTVGGKQPEGQQLFDAKTAKANLQSVKDLITYRRKLKSAIVKSNATTMVEFALTGKVSIAEAIEYKSIADIHKSLVNSMLSQRSRIVQAVDQRNQDTQSRIDAMVQNALGSDAKKSGDEYDAIAKPYLSKYEAKVVDPLDLKSETDKMVEELDSFLADVDIVINEKNALTMIEIND